MKSLGIPSRVGGRSSGPLVPWSAGPLVRWSPGPLVRWSPGPLVLWSAGPATKSALQGPQSPAPATNSTLPHQKLLRLPRNLHSKATKSSTCHEICTSGSTKSCACHDICTPRPTKSCTCHEICTSRSTKKSCACDEICAPRPIKSCTCHEICTPRPTKSCTCHEMCKVHKVLHLPRNTTTSKQARAAHLWISCAAGGGAAPTLPRATKSALHPRHPHLPRNQYFKVNSPVPNFSNQAIMPPLSLYLYLSICACALQGPQSPAPATNSTLPSKIPAPATKSALQGHKVLHLPRNLRSKATKSCACHEICTPRPTKSCTCHEICASRSTKSCACHEICTPRPIKSCAYHRPPTLHFNIHKVLHLPRNAYDTAAIVRLLLLLLLLFGIFFASLNIF